MAARITTPFDSDAAVMLRALELAEAGLGRVEPNPAVGAVLVDSQRRLLGEGFHEHFGGPHAEVLALREAGASAAGSCLFVTLQPCAHHGKTPPCTGAILAANVRRVVISALDPAPHSVGALQALRSAGIEVETGLLEARGRALIAPFTKLMTRGMPWVHAKWAMTLDGKIAARGGASKWITGEPARQVVHQLRGRMDAILVGVGTVLADDPLLTPRPAGLRAPLRIVLDPQLRMPLSSKLVVSAQESGVLVVAGPQHSPASRQALEKSGVEVLCVSCLDTGGLDLMQLLHELGARGMTNLLVEGGSRTLGNFFDQRLVDEAHCFIAPKILGGAAALGPVGGQGLDHVPSLSQLTDIRTAEAPASWTQIGSDIYCRGRFHVSSDDSLSPASENPDACQAHSPSSMTP